MKLGLRFEGSFKKDLKRIKKRNLPENELWTVVEMLRSRMPLPPKYRDHALVGNLRGRRECHIRPDWLLVYRIDETAVELILMRTGTHSEALRNSQEEEWV